MTYELKILCKNILLYSFWLCVVLICYHIRVDLTLIRTCHSQKSLEFNNYNTHVLMQHLLCVCLKSRERISSGRCPIPRCSNLDKQEISDIKLPRLIKNRILRGFTGFGHVTNKIHILVNFCTCCLFLNHLELSKKKFLHSIRAFYWLLGIAHSEKLYAVWHLENANT